MATVVQCPKCGRGYTVDDTWIGRSAPCEGCGQKFVLTPAGGGPRGGKAAAVRPDGTPERIGQYEVRRELGRGSFGVVYLGHNPFLNRDAAVKVLHLPSDEARRRFRREAQILAQIEHPHIVKVYDGGEHGGGHYLASQFIRGRTLADVVAAEVVPAGGMDPARAVRLTAQLVRALAFAHRFRAKDGTVGVVHRDVKPANAMVDDQDKLYLMDFGLAGWGGRERAAEASQVTQNGSLLGTPVYMSPEQAGGETDRVGPASDLYSAGVVLYELLTGRLPFAPKGDAPLVVQLHALLRQIVHEAAPPPRQYRPGLDAALAGICMKAMAKDPKDRYRDGEEFEAVLENWLTRRRGAPPPPPPPEPFPAPPPEAAARDTLDEARAKTLGAPPPAPAPAPWAAPAPAAPPSGVVLKVGLVAVSLVAAACLSAAVFFALRPGPTTATGPATGKTGKSGSFFQDLDNQAPKK